MMTCSGIESSSSVAALKHQLHAADDFVELIGAELRIGAAEIGPGVKVIYHQFKVVAANVVIEPADDRRNTIVAFLPGIQVLPLNHSLKLLRYQEIAASNVKSVRRECVKTRRYSVDRTRVNVFLEKLANKIKWTHPEPAVDAPRGSLVSSREHERRKGAIGIHQ